VRSESDLSRMKLRGVGVSRLAFTSLSSPTGRTRDTAVSGASRSLSSVHATSLSVRVAGVTRLRSGGGRGGGDGRTGGNVLRTGVGVVQVTVVLLRVGIGRSGGDGVVLAAVAGKGVLRSDGAGDALVRVRVRVRVSGGGGASVRVRDRGTAVDVAVVVTGDGRVRRSGVVEGVRDDDGVFARSVRVVVEAAVVGTGGSFSLERLVVFGRRKRLAC
jgi:hypothetical protein